MLLGTDARGTRRSDLELEVAGEVRERREELMSREVRVKGWKVEDEERIGGRRRGCRGLKELLLEYDEIDEACRVSSEVGKRAHR